MFCSRDKLKERLRSQRQSARLTEDGRNVEVSCIVLSKLYLYFSFYLLE